MPGDAAGGGAGQRRVGMAQLAVAAGGETLVTVGLGSCVAIAIHDAAAGAGGLAHVLLPGPELSRDLSNPARFPGTAVPHLLERLREIGAHGPYTARLVGGASMFRALLATGGVNVGERNVHAARAALSLAGIPLVGEDVGGEHGRSVYFRAGCGAVRVRSHTAGDRDL